MAKHSTHMPTSNWSILEGLWMHMTQSIVHLLNYLHATQSKICYFSWLRNSTLFHEPGICFME
jgi:hypothetical protein